MLSHRALHPVEDRAAVGWTCCRPVKAAVQQSSQRLQGVTYYVIIRQVHSTTTGESPAIQSTAYKMIVRKSNNTPWSRQKNRTGRVKILPPSCSAKGTPADLARYIRILARSAGVHSQGFSPLPVLFRCARADETCAITYAVEQGQIVLSRPACSPRRGVHACSNDRRRTA